MKTSELTGPALDWAVSEAEGCSYCDYMEDGPTNRRKWSTDWSQGGPIIERKTLERCAVVAAWQVDGESAAVEIRKLGEQ